MTVTWTPTAEYMRALIAWHDPDNADAQYLLLPRDAVEATRISLLPQTSPHDDVWWQLPEADRHTFRVVYFQIMKDAVAEQGDPRDTTVRAALAWPRDTEQKIVLLWLRWAAVRQAKSELSATSQKSRTKPRSWRRAYDTASERLQGTLAHGKWSTMKAAYVSVARILKAPAEGHGQ